MKTTWRDKEIALGRIEKLFQQADLMFKVDSKYSDRYVELARKISTKNKVTIPSQLKRRFCKGCGKFLVPGNNSRIRNRNSMTTITCLNCSFVRRFPYRIKE
jgi:ribonuclease P protein subunit RPR2